MALEGGGQSAVIIDGITKRYGRLTAVKNLSLEVRTGEILGFLGLNGAGKTTTIRILLDLIRPSAGKAQIFGHDCQLDGIRARQETGYLPGEMGIYSDLRGRDVLDFLAGLSVRPIDREYRKRLTSALELSDRDLGRKLREYSTGMKRKLGLVQALQCDPDLLILDEPTEGLDPLMQGAFYDLLADLRNRGRTVFMSSHVLSEVQKVCDRIALLRRGELVLHSTVAEVRRLAARTIRIQFSQDVNRDVPLPAGCEAVRMEARCWTIKAEGRLGPLMELLAGLPVEDLDVKEPLLEDVLVDYYREGAQ